MNDDDSNRMRRLMDADGAAALLGKLLDENDEGSRSSVFPTIPGYRIDRCIGRGGSAEVYLGQSCESTRPVAIKVLRTATADSPAMRRAWRELDLLSETTLPCVPEVLDYNILNGHFFIVTSHIEGVPLDRHIVNAQLDLRQRVELLVRVGQAVQQIHERGVIHRDLKPENILVRPNGTPAIIDFGIAAVVDLDSMDTLTQPGAPIGTVAFMAPEQARGERRQLSTRSDVYSLGAIACMLLTSHTPHPPTDSLHEFVRRVAQDPPRDPRTLDPHLPEPVAAIIEHAIAFEPSRRYASVSDFVLDLQRWLNNQPIDWQRPSWMSRQVLAYRRNRRHYLTKAAIWLLASCAMGASAFAVSEHRMASHERANAAESDRLRLASEELTRREIADRAYWEAEAVKREEWAAQTKAAEVIREGIRQRQAAYIAQALAEGEMFNATIAVLTIAEEIQTLHADDQESLRVFINHLQSLIDKAKQPSTSRSAM